MHFVSLDFLLFVAVSLVLFHATSSLAVKRAVLFASNLFFAAYLVATPRLMAPTAVFLGGGFLLVRAVQVGRRRWRVASSITLAVGTFVYLKQYSVLAFLAPLSEPYSAIGLSYLLFRIVHLLIDTSEGAFATPISFPSYFNYCCSFLCWLSGPIQRYEDHLAQEEHLIDNHPCGSDVYDALSRIVTGYFKVAVVSAVFADLHQQLAAVHLTSGWPAHFALTLGASASVYSLYMYYNFAGYMDVVIGLGVLFGFRLPENFNKPFASGNFLEFWSRWHITLSNWFKFYIFNATVHALSSRWGNARSTPYLGVLAYFITFGIMGVWHGSSSIFFLYGLFLGSGVSANKLYEIEARRFLGKDRFRRLRANRIYFRLCQGSVFAYFSSALLCFWATANVGDQLLAHPILAIAAYMAVTAAAALSFEIGALLKKPSNTLLEHIAPSAPYGPGAQLILGTKAYAVAVVILMQTTTVPEFVYVPF